MRYLGRKAELPQMLREVAQLEPAQRAAVGKAANAARQALEALIEARGERARRAPSSSPARRGPRRRHAAGRAAAAARSPARAERDPARARRHLPRASASQSWKAPRSRPCTTTSTRSTTARRTPRGRARTRSTSSMTDRMSVLAPVAGPDGPRSALVLRTHTSPMQVRAMEPHPPPLYIVVPGRVYRRDLDATHTPQFHQIEGLAVDEDITLADLKGTLLHFARAVFGDAREVRLRPHFFPFTEPASRSTSRASTATARASCADGSRCHLCKGEGWLEILGAGEVDPNVYAYVATTEAQRPRLRPREGAGLRVGPRRRADRDAQARTARPAAALRERPAASWSSSDEGPAAVAARVLRPRARRATRIEERLTMTGTKVEAIHRVGSPSAESFVVGHVLSAEQHPDADRLKVCRVDLGDGERRDDRLRRAERRRRPDGRRRAARSGDARRHEARQGEAARRRLRRDDPRRVRARDRTRGRAQRGIMVLDDLTLGRRVRAGHAARRSAADRDRGARARDHAEPARLPRRLRRRARAARRDAARRWLPAPWERGPGLDGRAGAPREVEVRCPDLCPRFTARVFENVTIAPSPLWLQARLTAAGQRPINNVVDITNYAMLLTRPAAARVRPRSRRRRGAWSCAARARASRCRRSTARRATLDGEMVVIEDADGPDLDRRADGRRALGGGARAPRAC